MAKGRKPVHPKIHYLKGNYRRDRHGEIEPMQGLVIADDLEPPTFLGEREQVVWTRIVPQLAALGILADIDVYLIAAYCTQVVSMERANQAIEENEGEYIEHENGTIVKHPAVQVRRQAIETLNKIGSEFGLSPMSRVRVQQAIPPNSQKPKASSLLEPRGLLD